MWLYLATLVGLYYLLRWYRERQVVSHLRDKYVFITGCDSGFGNLLARQLDLRGLRVLAACLTEKGAEQLRGQTTDRLETVILDVTKTESIAAATKWVKERTGDKEARGRTGDVVQCSPDGAGVPVPRNGRRQALGSAACAQSASKESPGCSEEAHPLQRWSFLPVTHMDICPAPSEDGPRGG
ncbi:17-beta-hydroxysteroid dehydrogenase type 6-like [Saccopteryx leptura]|uniref:17-beta-hydroxysteroid dehydrogenase type 6-like n=1 Tax=Saccopteryx leptura TaxID=249018 RepID=UPI00339D13B4